MLYQLIQTSLIVEKSPAQQVDTTSVLATELLGSFHVCYLFEKSISRGKVSKFKIRQCYTTTYLVDIINRSLGRAIDFILALGSAQQYIAVTHHAKVNATLQPVGDGTVDIVSRIGELGDGYTALCIVRQWRLSNLIFIN